MRELAEFQADLLTLLRDGVTGEPLREIIRARHPTYAAWVEQFDDRSEHIAHLILQRWLRDGPDGR